MSVPIVHTCGHTVEHNAWGKRIPWLESKPCPACAGVASTAKPADPKAPRQLSPHKAQANPENLPDGAVPEYRFDSERRWRFDYAWPLHKIALEIQGGSWVGGKHGRGKGFEADCEKFNRAAVLGWIVLKATPKMLPDVITTIRGLIQTSEDTLCL